MDGASGRLFQIDDTLSGSLFSVNTAAGLPVIEAFSDNTVYIGKYGNYGLFVSQSSVGIATTSPSYSLDVNGTGRFTAIIETSTERLKENIEPYTTELVTFMELNPVKFTWKESGSPDVGLIAEDVDKLLPEWPVTKTGKNRLDSTIETTSSKLPKGT